MCFSTRIWPCFGGDVLDAELVLTVMEVADRLRVTPEAVRRWIRHGELTAIRLGGPRTGYRIRLNDLNRFVSTRTSLALATPGVYREPWEAVRDAIIARGHTVDFGEDAERGDVLHSKTATGLGLRDNEFQNNL